MRSGLQDLAGEVARLRSECSYFLRILDDLEALSNERSWLSEAQEGDIERANHIYSRSAEENLARATDDLRNWWGVVDDIAATTSTHVAY
jgi:hypothetical protein